ncbi:TIGR01777 family oxidoreductase [Hufsiella ginkgonis]|uniref:TIGR01777 family protein n=1 Tax=Hufsiella ginkgonis TaxID=2695274 RepID=A0A7K1Y122_9SPHI|nr:TIGR01777 family oxidoreductase [Hufsiella ginkgonis]MXV16945.1 TIGR01777 family protein [Hufsiella ginkgonis]
MNEITSNSAPGETGKTILLTGGSGLVGKTLTELLLKNGHTVHHLTRNKTNRTPGARLFLWNVGQEQIDPASIRGVTTVIHLAGEGIAEKPWTTKRKEAIIKSRTDSIRLIYGLMKTHPHTIDTVISASAVGYYGDRGEEELTEESGAGTGFLSAACVAWEAAVDEAPEGTRVVKFRTGIVLGQDGGALGPLAKTVKFGLGTPLGSGKQWMPWIHIDDAARLYARAAEDPSIRGVFNMAAPNPVRNEDFTRMLAHYFKKPLWLPNVPAFALRILVGEMSTMVLASDRTSARKVTDTAFVFSYPNLADALKKIYGK